MSGDVETVGAQKVVWFEAIDPGGTICTGNTQRLADALVRKAREHWGVLEGPILTSERK